MERTAETLRDHFLDVVGPTLLALPEPSYGPAPGQVEPAIVEQDARGELVLENDAGLVVGGLPLTVAEDLDDVLVALLPDGDGSPAAVPVLERLGRLALLIAQTRQPLDDERRAVVGEGHADGVEDGWRLGDDLDLDPLGRAVALEARIASALIDEFHPFRSRWRGRARRVFLLGQSEGATSGQRNEDREAKDGRLHGEVLLGWLLVLPFLNGKRKLMRG